MFGEVAFEQRKPITGVLPQRVIGFCVCSHIGLVWFGMGGILLLLCFLFISNSKKVVLQRNIYIYI